MSSTTEAWSGVAARYDAAWKVTDLVDEPGESGCSEQASAVNSLGRQCRIMSVQRLTIEPQRPGATARQASLLQIREMATIELIGLCWIQL